MRAGVAALKRCEIPIFEPGLAELVATNMAQERLSFSTRSEGLCEADAVFLAVGTPSRRGDGHADLSYIYSAVREIAPLSVAHGGGGDEIHRARRHRRRDRTHPARRAAGSRHRRSFPIRNFCAKARRSTISNIRTGSSLAAMISRRAR